MDKEEQQQGRRTKANWLRYDDHNTSYFHSYANQHFCRNKFGETKALGDQYTSQNAIENTCNEYYKDIYTTSGQLMFEPVLDHMKSILSLTQWEALIKPF